MLKKSRTGGKWRSRSGCHTNNEHHKRASPRPTHLPFHINSLTLGLCDIVCVFCHVVSPPATESPPTSTWKNMASRYIVCCKRLAFDFTTCTVFHCWSFESCEEFESFNPHNWVNLNIHQPDFPWKLAQTIIYLLRVRSCFLLQRNLNAQIQSVGQVTKYYGTHRHTQIWKCLRDKALGHIWFVCSAKVAWNKSWKTVSKPISYYIDVHNSQKFRDQQLAESVCHATKRWRVWGYLHSFCCMMTGGALELFMYIWATEKTHSIDPLYCFFI